MSTRTSSGLRASVIIVNPRQKGNRVLEHIRNVPYQFGPVSMPVDYEVGSSAGVLFLR